MKREYVQTARAEETRRTGERILDAAFLLLRSQEFERVTLESVAADSGVTVQTIVRRFGSKEGVVRALAQTITAEVEAQRGEAPAGDIASAVGTLVDHYEDHGDLVMHLLRQETRVPAYAEVTAAGKQLHADWVANVFEPWLAPLAGVAHERLMAQLIAICDVYMWHLLRRQRRLSRRQTQLAIVELLQGMLA